jgi:hypothetical protein
MGPAPGPPRPQCGGRSAARCIRSAMLQVAGSVGCLRRSVEGSGGQFCYWAVFVIMGQALFQILHIFRSADRVYLCYAKNRKYAGKKKQVTSYYKFDRSYILLLPLETWLFNLKPIESMSCAEQD